VLQSLHIIVDEDGESRIESFSVRPLPHLMRRQDSSRIPQNLQWSDEAEVKKTLSTLAYSLGFDLAKRMAYVINE
jgi:hypothetical protein